MEAIRATLNAANERWSKKRDDAQAVRERLETLFEGFPHRIGVTDWKGDHYLLGGDRPHWYGKDLSIHIKSPRVASEILGLDAMGFLERFLEGEVDMTGNLYVLSDLGAYTKVGNLKPLDVVSGIKHLAFQDHKRASVSVKSHYDIPQEALNVYLDRVYMSYSCGMWEDADRLDREDLVRIGQGQRDDFDSLEKAMWRKFKDAADFIAPKSGETLLDVGCGYGGQLQVALENHPFGKVVGWTHSKNQVTEGKRLLEAFEPSRYELNEGDYRQDDRVYDHITSTGMISHVGPRGLVPYVKNIRQRIKKGGRYLHHALMTCYRPLPIDFRVGIAFNKKYVWPGFHWFSLGEHVRALEKNGFHVEGVRNLTRHYAKTTAAWHERMMDNAEVMRKNLGEPTFRAWQIFLAGITGAYLNKSIHIYRIYTQAV
jgi:cyclopropane-fatty-acyl-phospholipid synthase